MKIFQDTQFPASMDALRQLLGAYSINPVSYKAAQHGIENTTLFVSSDIGDVVVRVYRLGKKNNDDIQQELDFIQHMASFDIPVPITRTNSMGNQITEVATGGSTWQAIVMDKVEGVMAKAHTAGMVTEIAQTQARMHLAAKTFKSQDERHQLTELRETYFAHKVDKSRLKRNDLKAFIDRAIEYRVELSPNLPCGFCHLDYDKDNMLFDAIGHIAAVLDFDDLAYAPFVVDLAYTLWYIESKDGEAMANQYLEKYQKIRSLSKLETDFLQRVILFRHYAIVSLDLYRGTYDKTYIEKMLKFEQDIIGKIIPDSNVV